MPPKVASPISRSKLEQNHEWLIANDSLKIVLIPKISSDAENTNLFDETLMKFAIGEVQRDVNMMDLAKSFPTDS